MDSEPGIAPIAAPVGLGLAAFAAILLTDGTDELSWVRFLIATLVLFGVSWGGAYVLTPIIVRRKIAKQDAAHRAATVASFRAEVERMTGRPFPTDRATEK
ncbi:hypothetical protein [Streptomyces chartreusis]|uniref:hypothetical protein n=1 Tax=Streptomyces chartreusis TaxID=1969 RepID=UPI0038673AB6|nr:hypothetical protein OG938_48005 [Streptomyces chartreusis]